MDCDLSLFDVAIGMLTYVGTWHLSAGHEAHRTARSAHPSLVPFQNFPTADGWIVVGCAKEKFWQRLAETIGRPDLAADDRFATFADRGAHRDELVALLDEMFTTRADGSTGSTSSARRGSRSGRSTRVAEAFADPQTEARGLVVETDHPVLGTVRQPASPIRVGEPGPHRRAPHRGEDRDDVLRDLLHYDDERIRALEAEHAFGEPR